MSLAVAARRMAFVALIGLVPLIATPVVADSGRASQMKVAFTLKFSAFVRWGEHGGDDLRVCVLGSSEIVDRFRQAEGIAVSARRVRVATPSVSEVASDCDIAFISEEVASAELVEALASAPILTVGDGPSFLEHGGIIRLFESHNRMRFEISRPAAQRAGLDISSKLLDLARRSSE